MSDYIIIGILDLFSGYYSTTIPLAIVLVFGILLVTGFFGFLIWLVVEKFKDYRIQKQEKLISLIEIAVRRNCKAQKSTTPKKAGHNSR